MSRKSINSRNNNSPSRGNDITGLGGDQIEGKRAVKELLTAGRRRLRELLVSDSLSNDEYFDELEVLARKNRVRISVVPRAKIDRLAKSDAPQGVIAFAAPLRQYSLQELLDVEKPFILVLDGVTDPHNLGAIIRSANCAGVTGIVIPKHGTARITAAAAKSSAGAIEYMPIAVVPGIPSALAECKRQRVWVVGLDPDGDTSVFNIPVADEPIALVLGSEGSGISRLSSARCDLLAAINQKGDIDSLNVSAAAAIAVFAISKDRT